jgi:crotonobetainyl-CoA:carnitine CoA-transferase CaiB-like acyl-CoA transferase
VATALLLGLVARDRGAGGQHLASSMLNTVAHALADHVVDFPGSPGPPAPGPDFRGPSALYRIYDAADGWVFLAVLQADEWDALAEALHLRDDARFVTEADRLANDEALTAHLATVFASRSKEVWEKTLTAVDVACVAVNPGDLEGLFMGEAGREAGWVVQADHPTFGEHFRVAPLVRFSRSATRARGGALLGSATGAVLEEIGYGKDKIDELRERRVIA